MTKVFLDTNLIVYANDRRDPARQQRAMDLVAGCIRDGSGVVSTQVLQEYAAVALTKLHQQVDVVLRQLHALEAMEVVQVTPTLIRRALELYARYQTNYWDAAILAAAEQARCDRLWSEDFDPATHYGTVRVENPFTSKGDPRS